MSSFTFVHGVLITLGSTFLYSIPWMSIFLLLRYTGLNYYSINDSRKCKIIQRNLARSSFIGDDNKMFGYSFGKWYILNCTYELHRYNNTPVYRIWMIGTSSSYDKMVKTMTEDDVSINTFKEEIKEKQLITIYDTIGNYRFTEYSKREVKLVKHTPYDDQRKIIDEIKLYYTKTNNAVCFIYGKPGKGKTMISLLLAHETKSSWCSTFRPWEPSQKLCELYQEVSPTKESPLIISFDEIDVVLDLVHSNKIVKHVDARTEIIDKTGWNKFFDDIDYGLYPNMIIVMSSNSPIEDINELDSSYLRDGRVNLFFKI